VAFVRTLAFVAFGIRDIALFPCRPVKHKQAFCALSRLALPAWPAFWPQREFQTHTRRCGPYPGLLAEGRAALGPVPERYWFGFDVRDAYVRNPFRRPRHGA
jgi:hypothetical protein